MSKIERPDVKRLVREPATFERDGVRLLAMGDENEGEAFRALDQAFAEAKREDHLLDEHLGEFAEMWTLNRVVYERSPETAAGLRGLVGIGHQRQPRPGVVPPRVGATALGPPPQLDKPSRAVWGRAQTRAREKGVTFLAALADLYGQPLYIGNDDPPKTHADAGDDSRIDPSSLELDRRAHDLCLDQEVGYRDAITIADYEQQLQEARAADGSAPTAWQDTSQSLQPVPFSDEDWERDRRRADAAGLHVDETFKLEWEQAANEGRDIVYERAHADRVARVRALEVERDHAVASGRENERSRRVEAIEQTLDEDAKRRLMRAARE